MKFTLVLNTAEILIFKTVYQNFIFFIRIEEVLYMLKLSCHLNLNSSKDIFYTQYNNARLLPDCLECYIVCMIKG